MKLLFRLVHQTARQRAVEAILSAPDGIIVQLKEETRSLEQNAKIHALLTDVGRMLGWKFNGQSVDVEDLKSIFMAAYRKATGAQSRFVIGLDGQPVILNWRTRDMSKRECSEFIEMVNAWKAEREAA
jgi:hypothetical protein